MQIKRLKCKKFNKIQILQINKYRFAYITLINIDSSHIIYNGWQILYLNSWKLLSSLGVKVKEFIGCLSFVMIYTEKVNVYLHCGFLNSENYKMRYDLLSIMENKDIYHE